MTGLVTIVDAWRTHQISGKLVKRYPLGVTIDDARDIRHYATFDRVISGLEPDAVAIVTRRPEQSNLFN